MDLQRKCQQISNSYYNLGLEKAKVRDLSGAIVQLKNALHFNKYHTDARNLLGLIYYEIGEVGEAIVQWVISSNQRPKENIAQRYLSDLKKRAGRLEIYEQNLIKFNQGLNYANNGNPDLAILTLTRVVQEKPSFVKAQLLLALLYINRGEYKKAGKALLLVLRTDKTNEKALRYMAFVKENTGRADIENKKMSNAFSHRQMTDDDVIIPPTYKEFNGWQTALNIGVGILVGAAAVLFLYMPTKMASVSHRSNAEVSSISEKLSSAKMDNTDLQKANTDLQSQAESLSQQAEQHSKDNNYKFIQYQKLAAIVNYIRNKDIPMAAQIYAYIDPAQLVDIPESGVSVQEVYAQVSAILNEKGWAPLVKLGDSTMAAGDPATAAVYYDEAFKIKPDLVEAFYKRSTALRAAGDATTANEILKQLIANFPTSPYAPKAQAELNAAQTQTQPQTPAPDATIASSQAPTAAQADSSAQSVAPEQTQPASSEQSSTQPAQPAAQVTQAANVAVAETVAPSAQ